MPDAPCHFKVIETIDQAASRVMVQGNLFDPINAHRDDFYNLMVINEKEK